MRLIFGVLSLLIVLAIIGMLGKKQLQALGVDRGAAAPAAAQGMVGASSADANVAAQSRAMQAQVRDAAAKALQQGAERAASNPP